MILFLGFIFQLLISIFVIFYGYACATNLGFSETSNIEKYTGITIIAVGAYGIYDLSTMFNYVG